MKIFAIGDLHLPGGDKDKSMHVFGDSWNNHFSKIISDWQQKVEDDDIILIPGDISWAMRLEDAIEDLNSISQLKGRKVLLRGNHDYWWSSVSRIKREVGANLYFIQNNIIELDDVIIGGSRGWIIPNEDLNTDKADIKIFEREVNRLILSLSKIKDENKKRVAMMHFPPVLEKGTPTEFSKIMSQYRISEVVYGHIHGEGIRKSFNGVLDRVNYTLVSADALDFKLKEIILSDTKNNIKLI